MRLDSLRPYIPYALGLLAVVLALLARWPLWPLLGSTYPYITVFPAVLAAAYLGGLLPGLFATALGAAGTIWFVVEPLGSLPLTAPAADSVALILFVAGGSVMSWLCESLHATGRRARESEDRFARFMRHLPGLAWLKDTEGRYLFVNETAEQAFGRPGEELCGKTDAELFPPATAAQFRENDLKALSEGAGLQVVETLEHPDGTVHHSLVNKFAIPGPDGQPAFIGGTAIDVTDLRRLSALMEGASRLTSSLEPAAVRAAILDLSHRLIAADAHAIWRLDPATGEWSVADSAGLSESYIRRETPILAAAQPMPDRPIVAEDAQASATLESRWAAIRAEGIESVLAVPLRIHGRPAGTLAFYYRTRQRFDDVTVRVAVALGDLAGAAMGTAELYQRESDLRQRAEEADQAKDEFLALLGHELRNPLAPLRNAVQILELRSNDPAAISRTRQMIGRQVGQLTKLVEELLDASRIARGKVRLTPERLDLGGLVRTVIGDHRSEVECARLTVEVATPTQPVWVRGDPGRLAQVTTNLLNNAVKFTPTGGRIAIRVAVEGGEAILSVVDTGIGIASAALPTLFQRFTQLEADAARSKGGLGLGLAVVKGLIELHGGRVSASSDGPGHGSTFAVALPLDTAEAPTAKPARGGPPPPTEAVRRVVIVEDGLDAADSLRELLELKGFEVSIASTGTAGVELVRRVGPHAVVCDLGLPGMTGYEVAQALRADPATAAAILVAVSGYAQDDDRRKARDAGFDALLAKPADTDELIRLLTGPRG